MGIYNENLEITKAGKFHRLIIPNSIAFRLGIDMPSDIPGPFGRKGSVSGEVHGEKADIANCS